jgi:pimeloyl-ACP methyl ester carboxylesterase
MDKRVTYPVCRLGFGGAMRTLILFLILTLTLPLWAGPNDTAPSPDVLDGNSMILSGSPTIIFEAGGGDGPGTWEPLAPFTKQWGALFLYHRAGYGGSPEGKYPRTGSQIALELHKHLKRHQIKPPYVLVGHSIGGLYVQVFQRMFPAEVKGMVLIDPYKDYTKLIEQLREEFFRKYGIYPSSKELLLPPTGIKGSVGSELDNVNVTFRELWKHPLPKPIPTVYLSARQPLPPGVEIDPRFWAELMEKMEAQAKGITEALHGTFLPIESGHYIHKEHPDVVAKAINSVMAAIPKGEIEVRP